MARYALAALIALGPCVQAGVGGPRHPDAAPRAIATRIAPPAYLRMPRHADGEIPRLLSQTGAFKDTRNLVPADGLIPYDLIVPFWSDGAVKSRFMAIPAGAKITFSPTGDWVFPNGAVLVKTFELPTDEAHPDVRRRLETRLLVRDADGGVYGVVYRWRADGSDADLLSSSLKENITIHEADGRTREQTWYYPSRKDCITCHNAHTSGVLGPKTRQLNRTFTYPSGESANELEFLNRLGLLSPAFADEQLARFPKLAATDDTTRSLEERARSYLDANCSHCHRPGGTVAYFDARYATPPEKQEIIDGPVLYDEGIDRPRVISPHDIWRSIAFMRMNTDGDIRMPPLARETIDRSGVALLRQWILSLPGRDVVAPPHISPGGGNFGGAVEVSLSDPVAGARIRYTLDGSTPTATDALYDEPLRLTGPTVVRARAYKDGYTRSIISEAVFIVGQ